MKKLNKNISKNYCLILVLIFTGCATPVAEFPWDDQLFIRLSQHIYFLASDSLGGREAGTEQEWLAAQYLMEQLHQSGIRPYAYCQEKSGVDSFCYLMPFQATRSMVFHQSSIVITDTNGNGQRAFFWSDDFGNTPNLMFSCSLTAPVIFAGYGISAPEFNYDDYAQLDVCGKIVLVFDGEPASNDDRFFYGPISSSYSSAMHYKRHRAKELGAKALIVLASGKVREQWNQFREYFSLPKMDFYSAISDTLNTDDRIPFLYATPDFFSAILSHSPHPLDSLEHRDKNGLLLPLFEISSIRLRLQIHTHRSPVQSQNVIGWIEGTDPVLKEEFVAIGAHYDHLGKNEKGEIYYGADDNASGVSAVLEIARLLRQRPPLRSVLVIFHGAEEPGMLGSEYLTQPETPKLFKLSSVITYLNFDMVGRGHTDSLFVIGSDRKSRDLKRLIQKANKPFLFHFDYAFDRADDPHYYYYRSDHYHYASYGVPVAFFFDGMTADYHLPTDTPDKINLAKLRKTVELGYRLVSAAGNRKKPLHIDHPVME